ncbi:MAG: hypothetical protein KF862_19015 [Chitinophagaceae bacterium]|nr:hypothetical protein [Chitinophagaceae bacterium]
MNRRRTIQTLVLGTIGAANPLKSWQQPFVDNNQQLNPSSLIEQKSPPLSPVPQSKQASSRINLVVNGKFKKELEAVWGDSFECWDIDAVDEKQLLERVAEGEWMVWIGNPKKLPKELSIGAFLCSARALMIRTVADSPVILDEALLKPVICYSGYIAPPREMPYHNIDEEVRADFFPLLEAVNEFGDVVGYPGILMSYFAPSLVGRRFYGTECFCFFVEDPFTMLSIEDWKRLLAIIENRKKGGLQVASFTTNYASYRPGERVQAKLRLLNHREKAAAAIIQYSLQPAGAQTFTALGEMRRVAEGGSDTVAVMDFKAGAAEGLWTLRVEVLQDTSTTDKLAVQGNPVVVHRQDIGFVVIHTVETPSIIECRGPGFLIEGKEGFWAGTHYYPSTSWWEWVWRDFRPIKAASDFATIRKNGYRIVRIWIDPVIDEVVLRAMDAAIWLAAQQGIVLDICVFTQWVRYMGFEADDGRHVLFEFRHPRDFNIVSFSLRNLAMQRAYLTVISKRWKDCGSIFYNLANEAYVKDPDASQMDAEVLGWNDIPSAKGELRDSVLFQRWAQQMELTIRNAGGKQMVIPGYLFSTLGGGDVFTGNRHAPFLPWHSYLPVEQTALTLQYFDVISSDRPVLLEEFGVLGWNQERNYDSNTHYALAAGAAAAMSYEWGVSWLAREACYWPLPLREAGVDDPDPRWFAPYLEFKKIWSEYGVGICATPSGTGYGSIYHGTPFPAAAARALGRMGLMGNNLQRVKFPEKTYVIIPATNNSALEQVQQTLLEMWAEGIVFGIWQEADLETLPSSAQMAVCPAPLSFRESLAFLKSRNISVYQKKSDWAGERRFDKLQINKKCKTLVRRTAVGVLFTMVMPEPAAQTELQYQGARVSMDINDFGLVHFSHPGILLVEGEKKIIIDGKVLCVVERGRAIIASEDHRSLIESNFLKVMVTVPTEIRFGRTISAVLISDGSDAAPRTIGAKFASGKLLRINDQLCHYVLHVTF